jgi:hypothetical protein
VFFITLLGSHCSALAARFTLLGSRCSAHAARLTLLGSRCSAHAARFKLLGSRCSRGAPSQAPTAVVRPCACADQCSVTTAACAAAASRLAADSRRSVRAASEALSLAGGGMSAAADDVARLEAEAERLRHRLSEAIAALGQSHATLNALDRSRSAVVDAYDDLEDYLRVLLCEGREAAAVRRVHP